MSELKEYDYFKAFRAELEELEQILRINQEQKNKASMYHDCINYYDSAILI